MIWYKWLRTQFGFCQPKVGKTNLVQIAIRLKVEKIDRQESVADEKARNGRKTNQVFCEKKEDWTLIYPRSVLVTKYQRVRAVKFQRPIFKIKHNQVKNPNWQGANQLDIFKGGPTRISRETTSAGGQNGLEFGFLTTWRAGS